MPLQSPYSAFLADIAAKRANHQPVAIRLHPCVTDRGDPSTRALDARNERIASAIRERDEREARERFHRDYATPHFDGSR